MHKSLLRGALALGLASVLFVASSMAANRVEVRVIHEGGQPVVGVTVDVFVSSGVISGVTDESGRFVTDIGGTFFRVKVDGSDKISGHTTADGPVTVTLD